ncbi:MAG: chromosomal replication initiator protein DnaA [Solirubrobacterales bacterium]|nr:chromosomal replication initiator protein DnaA [Solirubrobacterales bacterium]
MGAINAVSDTTRDAEAAWLRAREELRASVHESTFQQWFEPLTVTASRGPVIYLTAPPRVAKWVRRRYLELIHAALLKAGGSFREVELTVERTGDSEAGGGEAAAQVALNPGYSFDRFVIGPENRIAHGAALAVAEQPGQAYNPLFLHGPPGLGKTHLLGAIANYLHEHSPELVVHYTTAECFTNEFVAAVRTTKRIDSFKERYRRAEVLLIDDVQFLEGKSRTGDEFFHTFNALYEAGAQLVFSADRMPSELVALAERLRGRFEWGLVVDMADPDLATRLTVIDRLLEEREQELSPAAIRAIADRSGSNLRVLQGALTRVMALSSLTDQPITETLIERALPNQASADPSALHEPTIEEIQRAVAEHFGFDQSALNSTSRVASLSKARQLAMFLARQLTTLSLPSIAAGFNRRDHTTVIHAIRKVEERSAGDSRVAATIRDLSRALSTRAAGVSGRDQS